MRIQAVSNYAFPKKHNIKHSKNNEIKTNNINFKSYNEALIDAVNIEFKNVSEVSEVAIKAFIELLNENGTQKKPIFNLVKDWIFIKPTYFIEEICKPLAKMNPDFRNLIFDSNDKNLIILQGKNDKDGVFLVNLGKQGFFNSLFHCESARNDMRLVFTGDAGDFELSTDKDGNIIAEQFLKSGHWEKSFFNRISNRVLKKEEGNSSDNLVWF